MYVASFSMTPDLFGQVWSTFEGILIFILCVCDFAVMHQNTHAHTKCSILIL